MADTAPVSEVSRHGGPGDLESLLQAVATKKDKSAFEAFYDATVKRIYGIALRITQSHEMAEEVVSDVYLQVWRQASRFDPGRGGVMAWLTVLGRSRALDALRHDKTTFVDERLDLERREGKQDAYPQDLILAVERNTAVHAALSKLSEGQRQLLALAYFRDFSHSELARFTGMPIGTVKTQLRRTLIALKELMADLEFTPGVENE